MKSERCPICDKGTLKREVKDELFKYKGKNITIHDYVVHKCNACREAIVDNATLKASGKILKAFKHEIDERRA
jgi:YgiT-type zinc finger domain-containing protein